MNWLSYLSDTENNSTQDLQNSLDSLPQDELLKLASEFGLIDDGSYIEEMAEKIAAAERMGRELAHEHGDALEKEAIAPLVGTLARGVVGGAVGGAVKGAVSGGAKNVTNVANGVGGGFKYAAILGAQVPESIEHASIPYEIRKKQYSKYVDEKSKEEPTGYLKGTTVGGLLGAGLGAGFGALSGLGIRGGARAGALAGGSIGGVVGGLGGALSAHRDKKSIESAKQMANNPELIDENIANHVGEIHRARRAEDRFHRWSDRLEHQDLMRSLGKYASKEKTALIPGLKTVGQKLVGGAVRNPTAALAAGGALGGAIMAPRDPQTGEKQRLKGALTGASIGTAAGIVGGNKLRHAILNRKNPILGEGVANYARQATKATHKPPSAEQTAAKLKSIEDRVDRSAWTPGRAPARPQVSSIPAQTSYAGGPVAGVPKLDPAMLSPVEGTMYRGGPVNGVARMAGPQASMTQPQASMTQQIDAIRSHAAQMQRAREAGQIPAGPTFGRFEKAKVNNDPKVMRAQAKEYMGLMKEHNPAAWRANVREIADVDPAAARQYGAHTSIINNPLRRGQQVAPKETPSSSAGTSNLKPPRSRPVQSPIEGGDRAMAFESTSAMSPAQQAAFMAKKAAILLDDLVGGAIGYRQGQKQHDRGEKHTFGGKQVGSLFLPGGVGYQVGRYFGHDSREKRAFVKGLR